MRKIKKIVMLSLFAMFLGNSLQAQDKDNPWAIGIGANIIDVNPHAVGDVGDNLKDYVGITKDVNYLPVLSRIYVARYLGKGFSADFTGSLNSIDLIPEGQEVSAKTYYSLDLGIRYDLNHAFGNTGWFDPYVKLAGGPAWVEDDWLGVLSGGLGFNTWFNDSVGLNFESSYRTSSIFGDGNLGTAVYVEDYHFQHSVSLVIRFGGKDTDGDGVNDKKDLCPKVAGLKQFSGCPDSDGDGVADKDDDCPAIAGKAENKGCPDSDGDGVVDSKDKCPNKAGSFSGCPDSDGDGVADHLDKCATVNGPKENGGCPWPDSDRDGVTDNLDKCPNVAGLKTNNGCPPVVKKLTAAAKAELGAYAKTIQFNSGKTTFKPGVATTLDKVAKVMNQFEEIKFDVEGHADSQGNDDKNLKLSQRRAQAVVDYLATHGIKGSRLHAVGYGEVKPIATNKTRAGRAKNRRVVLTAIEK